MSNPAPDLEEVLVGYVSKALELKDSGEQPRLDLICAEHPELIQSVAAAIEDAGQLASLAASAHEHDPMLGRELDGRYRLDARLGAGAMGIVYRGFDLRLSRTVAVKILRPELFGGRDAEQRFVREAEVLAKLRHTNIVAVHDSGRTPDGVAFLVMELLTGQPLMALLGEHQRRVEAGVASRADDMGFVTMALRDAHHLEQTWLRQSVRWTAEIASGLAEAHRAGVLHRDVKPSNVFIARDGSARVIDFGVAASESHATLTAIDGASPGTPAYMAPEVIVGRSPASAASDIYGLGATLYQLLTRRPPYLGTATHVIASVQRRDPIPVGRLRSGLPRDLHAIVDRAMTRDPGDRYASMAEFEADLRAFLNHQPVVARPVTALARLRSRIVRSPLARAAGILLAVAGTVFGILLWRAASERARDAAHTEVTKRLPPGLGLELPELRFVTDEVERKRLTGLLDSLVATAREPIPSRLLRATFHLDHGNPAAATDMAEIAKVEPSALTEALALRYADVVRAGGKGHASLDLSGLPEPTNDRDRYLVSFHALRTERSAASNEVVVSNMSAVDVEWLPAQELLAGALLFRADLNRRRADRTATVELLAKAVDITVRVESRRGCRTAATAQALGLGLIAQGAYQDAAKLLRAAVDLCPSSNGLWRNLGLAHRRAGDLAVAATCYQTAKTLRPAFVDNYRALASVYAERGDFALARAVAAEVPDESARTQVIGQTEFDIAVALLAGNSDDLAIQAADAAARSLRAVGDVKSKTLFVAEAISAGNGDLLFDFFLERFTAEPWSWHWSINLSRLMTTDRVAARADRLAAALQSLALSQSPARPLERQ